MRLLLRAALVLMLFVAAPALAQDNAPALAQDKTPAGSSSDSVAIHELERLAATLEDEVERARLVKQLRAVVTAQRGLEAEDNRNEGVLSAVSERIGQVGDDVLKAAGSLIEVPRLVEWTAARLGDPETRRAWGELILRLGAILGAGLMADRGAAFLLSRARRAAVPAERVPVLVRLPLVAARALIDLLPIAAFTGAGYAVVSLLALNGNVRVAAVTIITAYAGLRLFVVLVRMLVAPRTPTLRLVAVDDETAEYLVIWTRRLAGVGVFGYFLADAARLLGLPQAGFSVALKGVGFAMAVMVIIFIQQNRVQVCAAMHRAADRWAWGRRLQAVANRIADVWHILAAAYVGAAYLVWAIPVTGGFEYMLRATVLTVVILSVASIVSTLARRLIDRGFAVSAEARDRFPLLEARVNRYLPVMHTAFRAVVVVATLLALMQVWGMGTFAWIASELGQRVLASVLSIAAVLIGALVLWEVFSGAIERYLIQTDADGKVLERSARARTLLPLLRNALMVVLVVMVALIVLSELGVNIAPLLAGAGVIGIAIGFGSQKLVQDVITGAFILFEDTISVGDVVRLDAHSGLVEAMSIRAIRLRDLNGNVHTIPFSGVGTIVNMSKEFSYALVEAGVAYREDTDHVTEVLKELGAEMCADAEFGPLIMEEMEVIGVDRFEASAVIIRVRFKTVPLKQWAVTREFNRRMKKRFDAVGIEIPFPHTTIYFGEDKKGAAPPARVLSNPLPLAGEGAEQMRGG